MDELISRTELLDKVKEFINPADINQYIVWCKLIKIVEELPTIPPLAKGGSVENDKLYIEGEHIKELLPTIPQTAFKHFGCIECPNCARLINIFDIDFEELKVKESYKWCKGCKEYDTENHCCHRYTSFIRETLQDNIDAVLEDIKAEIEEFKNNEHTYEYGGFDRAYNGIMEIINKHISRKESEEEE